MSDTNQSLNYFIYYKPTKQSHEYLTFDGLVNVLRSDLNYNNWLIWKPELNSWAHLNEDSALVQKIINHQQNLQTPVKPPAPSPEESAPTPRYKIPNITQMEEGEFEIVEFTEASHQPTNGEVPPHGIPTSEEKRKFPRIRGKLRTIITDQDKAFLTYTEDVSLGGVKLQHAIPLEIVRNKIEIYITAPSGKSSIVFRCKAIMDQSGFYRFEFSEDLKDYKSHLASWLDSLR